MNPAAFNDASTALFLRLDTFNNNKISTVLRIKNWLHAFRFTVDYFHYMTSHGLNHIHSGFCMITGPVVGHGSAH